MLGSGLAKSKKAVLFRRQGINWNRLRVPFGLKRFEGANWAARRKVLTEGGLGSVVQETRPGKG